MEENGVSKRDKRKHDGDERVKKKGKSEKQVCNKLIQSLVSLYIKLAKLYIFVNVEQLTSFEKARHGKTSRRPAKTR